MSVLPHGQPLPTSDHARLAALRGSGLAETGPEEAFDRLTRLARRALGVPVALLTLVEADRLTIKSADSGDEAWRPARHVPLSHTFCRHVVDAGRPFVVGDARETRATREETAATELGVAAYAGVPVVDGEGHVLGALAVLDAAPRRWAPDELAVLDDLAAAAAGELRLRALAREAEHAAAIVGSSEDLILGLDAEGVIRSANPALARSFGHDPADVIGRPLGDLVPPERREELLGALERVLGGERVHDLTTQVAHGDGTRRHVSTSIAPLPGPDGQIDGMSLIGRDVSERRRAEGELRRLADQDPLTGLLNRRSFRAALERHLAAPRAAGSEGAVLVLDLDHFKAVNDTLGHAAGDELIVGVAELLRGCLRDDDLLARLGGDEFAILLPRASADEAAGLAHRLGETLHEQPIAAGGREHRQSTSVGIAAVPPTGGTVDELLGDADLAMYDAKDAGRGGWAIAGRRSDDRHGDRGLSAVQRIRRALDEDRFDLVAQPVLDLRTGAIAQHELLLRMIGDAGEPIPPGDFLPVAERFDLIQEIDRWVVRRAIALVAAHGEQGLALPVSVNVSAKSLSDPQLLPLVRRELLRTGVEPALLTFEIAEDAAVSHLGRARAFIRGVGALGCRVALDHFGTGPLSLAHLRHLPVDTLKIDGEFVAACTASGADERIVDAVVELARGLGKATVAEHVPDGRTLAYLRGRGVDYAQGFHIAGPRSLRSPLTGELPRL
jgi:diguanylate cyclase (GGDEF)-like protein/PAS domain S-box-containing protein